VPKRKILKPQRILLDLEYNFNAKELELISNIVEAYLWTISIWMDASQKMS
jgi:hypothetical protein